MPREKLKTERFLSLTALLLIAATLIFLVILVPLTIISIGPNVSILTLGLIVIITTVASLITLLFYIMLTKNNVK
jgi:uncharacterized RDD family membrane protein YckC